VISPSWTAAAVLVFVAGALAGCADSTNAVLQTFQQTFVRSPSVEAARLDPAYRYLRVSTGGRVALLALGYIDDHPRGAIEVWYSAQKEVLRLQNGRMVGLTGLSTDWRQVFLPDLPSWSELARTATPFLWARSRDVMPGYRFGVRDALQLRVTPPPQSSELRDFDPQRLTWFEERMAPDGSPSELPPARYAVQLSGGEEIVVYGEQCVAADLCLSWQRWPAGS
jgi:hypothetical protein